MQSTHGFTLLELLIVVTIIVLIAALAFPTLSASRRVATEASVISVFRTAFTVNEMYRQRRGTYAGSPSDLVAAGLMPSHNGNIFVGARGYAFGYNPTGQTYTITAAPTVPGQTGDRWFFEDQTGVIRFSTSGPATASSPPVR